MSADGGRRPAREAAVSAGGRRPAGEAAESTDGGRRPAREAVGAAAAENGAAPVGIVAELALLAPGVSHFWRQAFRRAPDQRGGQ